jgi:putative endonuclease
VSAPAGVEEGTVYLLCFNEPIGNPDTPHGTARHYVGWTSNLEVRIAAHTANLYPQEGSGWVARIVAHVQRQGIGFELVRTWPGGYTLEKQIKSWKNAPRLCPNCRVGRKES